MNSTEFLPYVTGVAAQRYLRAEEGLVAARDEGCSHWYIDASILSDMPHNWSAQRRKELAAAAADQGMAPLLHGNFRAPLATEIPELQVASLEYVRREIDLAEDLGATALIIHGGVFVEPRPTKAHRDAALERFLDLLAVTVREAEQRGVAVWLENLSYYPKYRPFSYVFTRETDFAAALEAIPELKFILDIGHANVNQELAQPALAKYASSIAALSLSNNAGDQDAHLALDEGTLSMEEITRLIKAADWRGLIAFETRNASVQLGLDYLTSLWNSDALLPV
ncbi:sugar phosphate isomerase/epimerase family protein [Kitasatospora sp. MMS16-BH015]|uniref:sugar phosphate isomerase/epimerase family protein n=1 Tax=Kitasatospora sp. MMS16-BH015 TaxID=2018025 RepID=UPI000CF2A76D|nr:sugar phosphate isomerase/epimerase family protein [Kitasatospora sp. MMS16-BH015]